MQISRVTRVSNPRRRASSRKRRNPKRLSLKQKLHFGTPRQRAAAKAALSRKRKSPKRRTVAKNIRRRTVRASNPRRRRRVARANPVRRRRRRKANPAYLLHLGAVNPAPRRGSSKRRKKSNMARTKRRNTRRRRASANPRRRRRNSVRVIVRRRNRRRAVAVNPRRRRRHYSRRRASSNPRRRHYGRRRNPMIFGHSVSILEAAKVIAAGLAGVWATQFVVGMLPANLLPQTPVTGALVNAAVAVGLGTVASMIMKGDPLVGYAIGFGGLMLAGGIAATSFGFSQFGLRGLGDLVPGRFPIPMNPISAGNQMMLPPPAIASGAAAGVGAIYNPFGRAM